MSSRMSPQKLMVCTEICVGIEAGEAMPESYATSADHIHQGEPRAGGGCVHEILPRPRAISSSTRIYCDQRWAIPRGGGPWWWPLGLPATTQTVPACNVDFMTFTIDDYLSRLTITCDYHLSDADSGFTHTTCTCRSGEVDKVIQKRVSTLLDVAVTIQREGWHTHRADSIRILHNHAPQHCPPRPHQTKTLEHRPHQPLCTVRQNSKINIIYSMK
jgi:hypothetical protein